MFSLANSVSIRGIHFTVNPSISPTAYAVFMTNFTINCTVKLLFVNSLAVIGRFMTCKVWIDNHTLYAQFSRFYSKTALTK